MQALPWAARTDTNFYNNFQIVIKVNYHPLMKAVIHIPAIFCRWIIIILQLWQNFCSCNTHCVRSINKREENTEGTERTAQHFSCLCCQACECSQIVAHWWIQRVKTRPKQTETHAWVIITIIWVVAIRMVSCCRWIKWRGKEWIRGLLSL
jgi:hypothetical protein